MRPRRELNLSLPEGSLSDIFDNAASNPRAFNERQRMLWVACGKDDFLFQSNQRLDHWLTDTGIRHEYVVTEGAHTWLVWRDYLETVLGKLFR